MTSSRWFWPLLFAAVILVVVVMGGSGVSGPPLDPRSVSPDGARGVVEVLERYGVDVDASRSVPRPDDDAALMLVDRLTPEDEARVMSWVRSGGVLVVADQRSSFIADRVASFDRSPQRGVCDIAALGGVESIEIERGNLLDASDAASCFGDRDSAFVVDRSEGDGNIVSLGTPYIFTNAVLDESDAAVLAVSLLAPRPNGAGVTFIGPSVVSYGDETLGDLIAPRVYNSIYQLMAAFLLYGMYRSRRLGKVVPEPLPVRLMGSDLVLHSGVLSQRAHDPAGAAEVLRHDFVQRAQRSLSLPSDLTDSALATIIAGRQGLDADRLLQTLTSRVSTEDELTEMANHLAEVDAELLGGHRLRPDERPDP